MKLIKRTVALLFALVVAGTAAIPSLADEPLLRNGGLEEIKEGDWDPDAGEEPLHWDVWPGNPAEGTKHRSISTSIKHGGKQSLCVELSDKNKQAVYQYAELILSILISPTPSRCGLKWKTYRRKTTLA